MRQKASTPHPNSGQRELDELIAQIGWNSERHRRLA
jgi:hypothetical protein